MLKADNTKDVEELIGLVREKIKKPTNYHDRIKNMDKEAED